MATRLPVVLLIVENKPKEYFADIRLREYRAVNDPHDRLYERDCDGSMEDIIEEFKITYTN